MRVRFELPDKDGKILTEDDFKGKWMVLYFYPKDNTPGCTTEAIEFTKLKSKFKKLDAEIVGVSPDSEKSHCNFHEKHNLGITLLSDKDKKLSKYMRAFGKKKMYGKEFDGIIRSTFLINPKGKIIHEWKNVRASGHAEKVLEGLKEIQ